MVATCLPLIEEKVRAEVYLGNVLLAKTPFVLSFSVSKARTQLTNTATVQLELLAGASFPLGEQLKVVAGLRGDLKEIFSGEIVGTRVDPSFGKPSYYKLTLTAQGVLSKLEGKKFSRRLRTDGQGLFAKITSAPGARPTAGYSPDLTKQSGNGNVISGSPNPVSTGGQGKLPFVTYEKGQSNPGSGGRTAAWAHKPQSSGGTDSSSGSNVIHDHGSLEKGGPSWGVYSSD